ncbi:Chlorogenate esterase [Marinobacterium lacunae]|uniref:Chlorogenate esterase n=1 Tax=Marinobacterium lacunae TaxID=1232683 RepID=A0A081FWU3_9GAMM|nr:tannase/feruloyl esterase family alpha/beta hydrolase [Marinobacterium lacunae]KEA62998.1 Chlorogenate esterase [Marinobacterium lacunae]MBR9884425.1 tannase/feruloyl esterase family alpha/beta hydrolase [Oceanospirillales bacterium]
MGNQQPFSHRLSKVSLGALLIAGASQSAYAQLSCSNVNTDTLGIPGVRVESSQPVAESASLPAHCQIRAVTAERVGQDGHDYAIQFEMNLPDQWNGSFVHQFNGGNDGEVKAATGPLLSGNTDRTALGEGYAVLSSDAGHDGSTYPEAGLAGGSRFGLDPEARLYYGYKTVETLTPIAKQIIHNFYDQEPEYSYGVGCSNGGRHAMVAASRLGDAYDGFLVGAPGFNLPKAAVQHALDVQQLSAINGDVRTSLTDEDRVLVASAVIQACDALDGLEDQMVSDIAACQATFDIDNYVCAEGQSDACIAPAKAQALKTIYAGPKDRKGNALYSDWAWDPGIAGGNWKFWKISSGIPPWDNLPLIGVMGSSSLAQIFTTPPTEIAGDPATLNQFLLDFDIANDGDMIYARRGKFHESAMSFMTPPDVDNPKLKKFNRSGGKMIIFHGVSDPVFSYLDTENWYKRLSDNYHGKADRFVKLYPVPGMNHCSGGMTTDDFNLFEQLVNWVENGEEPEAVMASHRAGAEKFSGWSETRTRKLCPYPQTAKYTGGDPESAESFTCE